MKKLISMVLCLGMLMGILSIASFADETELVAKGSEWSYVYYELVEGEEPTPAPEGWTTGTDADTWEVGATPFAGAAYTSPNAQTVLTSSFEAYLVKTFTVEDASAVKVLTLSVIYDEDPVVYINGTEVWSTGGYNDKAYTSVDLSDKTDLLKDGENVIAVSFRNAINGGGALMDLGLTCDTEVKYINDDGTVIASGATSEGFASFGGINAPTNVLDGDNGSCCG
ncbi:MAG: hypothetical protein E7675_01395, partial [Ruminococcaceae bacterium]|nr:hypothetical protein [Oscillospiraceae bacterium]